MRLPVVASVDEVTALPAEQRPVIVDLRSADQYAAGRLPGAFHLEPALLNRSEPPVGGLLPARDTVVRWFEHWSLGDADHLLAYDLGGETAAARLVWVLDAYGFGRASLLDGGIRAWHAADQPLERDEPLAGGGGAAPGPGAGARISVEQLLAALDDEDTAVLDVRSTAEYEGRDVRAMAGGHVPGAVHLEWTALLDQHGLLKPADEIRGLLDARDVTPDKRVVVYCQTHQRSAHTYAALKSLGFERVEALDGAWSAWGNRADTPKHRPPGQ